MFAEAATQAPSDTPRRVQTLVLIDDHGGRCGLLERPGGGMPEVAEETANVSGGGVRAAPRRPEIAPVGGIPVPIVDLIYLTLHSSCEDAPTEPHRRILHPERPIELVAQEI